MNNKIFIENAYFVKMKQGWTFVRDDRAWDAESLSKVLDNIEPNTLIELYGVDKNVSDKDKIDIEYFLES